MPLSLSIRSKALSFSSSSEGFFRIHAKNTRSRHAPSNKTSKRVPLVSEANFSERTTSPSTTLEVVGLIRNSRLREIASGTEVWRSLVSGHSRHRCVTSLCLVPRANRARNRSLARPDRLYLWPSQCWVEISARTRAKESCTEFEPLYKSVCLISNECNEQTSSRLFQISDWFELKRDRERTTLTNPLVSS